MNEDYCIKCKAPILFREQPCPGCGHKTCPLKKENNIFKINGYITAITFFINKIIINVLAILLGIAVLLLCLKFNLINEKSIISNMHNSYIARMKAECLAMYYSSICMILHTK